MNYPIVLVKWIDAAIHPGWLPSHDGADLAFVETVGYLLYKDERRIKVAQSNSSDVRFSSIQSIPKDSVIKIIKIRGKNK